MRKRPDWITSRASSTSAKSTHSVVSYDPSVEVESVASCDPSVEVESVASCDPSVEVESYWTLASGPELSSQPSTQTHSPEIRMYLVNPALTGDAGFSVF